MKRLIRLHCYNQNNKIPVEKPLINYENENDNWAASDATDYYYEGPIWTDKWAHLVKTAAIPSYKILDSFSSKSGIYFDFTVRIVNNEYWFQISEDVNGYGASSFYDGNNLDKALRTYKDLLLAFKGVIATESFLKKELDIKHNFSK